MGMTIPCHLRAAGIVVGVAVGMSGISARAQTPALQRINQVEVETQVAFSAGLGPELHVLLRNQGDERVHYDLWFGWIDRRDTCASSRWLEDLGVGTEHAAFPDASSGSIAPRGFNHRVVIPLLRAIAPPCDLVLRLEVVPPAVDAGESLTFPVSIPATSPARPGPSADVKPRLRFRSVVESVAGASTSPVAQGRDNAEASPQSLVLRLLVENIGDGAAIVGVDDRGVHCADNRPRTEWPRWTLEGGGWRVLEAEPRTLAPGSWAVYVHGLYAPNGSTGCHAWLEMAAADGSRKHTSMEKVGVDLGQPTQLTPVRFSIPAQIRFSQP